MDRGPHHDRHVAEQGRRSRGGGGAAPRGRGVRGVVASFRGPWRPLAREAGRGRCPCRSEGCLRVRCRGPGDPHRRGEHLAGGPLRDADARRAAAACRSAALVQRDRPALGPGGGEPGDRHRQPASDREHGVALSSGVAVQLPGVAGALRHVGGVLFLRSDAGAKGVDLGVSGDALAALRGPRAQGESATRKPQGRSNSIFSATCSSLVNRPCATAI